MVPFSIIKVQPSGSLLEYQKQPQAYFGAYLEHSGVHATSKQLLYFFLNQLTTANRTFLERSHLCILVRQFIHRSGSGRYTVINTAHCVSGLYAHTL